MNVIFLIKKKHYLCLIVNFDKPSFRILEMNRLEMKTIFARLFCVALFSLFFSLSVPAQSLETGKKLYNEGKFSEAKVIFEKQVKAAPRNASLNHWYGVCLIKTGEPFAAEKYLKFAASKRIQESNRYLGELYFDTYRFDEAVECYEIYIESLKKDEAAKTAVAPLLRKAEMGARMLKRVEEVQIIDSMVVDKKSFFTHYKLSPESGQLFRASDFFKDESSNGTLYQTQRGDKVLYGKKSGNGECKIVSRNKLSGDDWSEPAQLPQQINMAGNVNYPFLLSDGVTLYFASDNKEESLGGYDLFVTRYNITNDSYLAPENMGMPFNSPYNDYLLAIDDANGVGWFVTDRFQPEDKVIVYLFIPNATKQIVRDGEENPDKARSLAMIRSIRETWSNSGGYDELLNAVYNAQVQEEKKKGDFDFVVTNDVRYFFWDDFVSKEAKSLYEKALSSRSKIVETDRKLNDLRQSYAAQGADKSTLTPKIKEGESALLQLYGEPEKLEIEARNAEIKALAARKK